MLRAAAATATIVLLAACVRAPTPPRPDRSAVWGYVRLVPHEGVTPGGGSGYSDRRLRDVRYVDYSRPGFAVVFAEGTPRGPGRARLEVRANGAGPVLEPAHSAVALGGAVEIANRTDRAHVVSSPATGLVRPLAPGESVEIRLGEAGRHDVFVLDGETPATVFAIPGAFSVTARNGHFELPDLPPGPTVLRVWHPRFPAARHEVELQAGRALRIDLEVGVDVPDGELQP